MSGAMTRGRIGCHTTAYEMHGFGATSDRARYCGAIPVVLKRL